MQSNIIILTHEKVCSLVHIITKTWCVTVQESEHGPLPCFFA